MSILLLVCLLLQDVEGAPEAVKKLGTFSLLLSDMVVIQEEGVADVLTKISKEFGGVSYNIGDGVRYSACIHAIPVQKIEELIVSNRKCRLFFAVYVYV